jgi:hypothetical protein
MPKCAVGQACGGRDITGKVYFVDDRPVCVDDAKPSFAPRINQRLRDTSTLINTFGGVMPLLGTLGGVEMAERDTPQGRRMMPVKSWGFIATVTKAFQEGTDLFRVSAAASKLAGDARFFAAGYLLWAAARLNQMAYPSYRGRVRRQAQYATVRFLESMSHRRLIQGHLDRRQLVPSDERRAFMHATNDAFHNALAVFKVLAGSFRRPKMAALVIRRDSDLVEKVVGFNPADLVARPEDEVDPGQVAKPPAGVKAEAAAAAKAPAEPPEPTPTPEPEEDAEVGPPSIEAILALPDEKCIIRSKKGSTEPLKSELTRAQALLKRYGGWIWGTESRAAMLRAAALRNGSSIRVTEGRGRERRTG